MDLEQLGMLIHDKREQAGIPLAKAAKKAGIGRSTLWIIESGRNPKTGKPSRPSKDILERLAQALFMSQDELTEAFVLADYNGIHPVQTSQQVPPSLQTIDALQTLPASTHSLIVEGSGTVYVVYAGRLQAFDARTGNRLWSSDLSPLESALTNELSSLRDAVEQIHEELAGMSKTIQDIRKHVPVLIKRAIEKLEAKLNSDLQGAPIHTQTERHTPSRKGQKASALT